MSIEAMKQALETFEKIHEGCGFVKKNNINKHANDLATLVRKDCNFAMEDLRQAIEQAEKQAEKQKAQCIRPPGKSWLTVNPEGNVEMRKHK